MCYNRLKCFFEAWLWNLLSLGKPESSDYGSNVLVKIVGDARDKAYPRPSRALVFLDTLALLRLQLSCSSM